MPTRMPCGVNMRKSNIAACVLFAAPLCCVRQPPEWYKHQDLSVKMPCDGKPEVDMVVDGPTLRALRLAADDWMPPPESKYCEDTQAAHLFHVRHSGDIIYVDVVRDPAACGGQGYALHGNGTYAISRDGRILRRAVEGDGTCAWPKDAGVGWPVPLDANGKPYEDATATVDLRALPPEILDGGLTPDFLATVIVIWPDGGVTMPEGAMLPVGWDGGLMPSDWVYYEIARWRRAADAGVRSPMDAGAAGGLGTDAGHGADGGR